MKATVIQHETELLYDVSKDMNQVKKHMKKGYQTEREREGYGEGERERERERERDHLRERKQKKKTEEEEKKRRRKKRKEKFLREKGKIRRVLILLVIL